MRGSAMAVTSTRCWGGPGRTAGPCGKARAEQRLRAHDWIELVERVPDGGRQENGPEQPGAVLAAGVDRLPFLEHQHRRHHHRKEQIDEAEQRQQRGVSGSHPPDHEARLAEAGVEPQDDRIPGPAVQRHREIEGQPHGHPERRQDDRQVKPGPRVAVAAGGGGPDGQGREAGQASGNQRALLERNTDEMEEVQPGAMQERKPDGARQEDHQLLGAGRGGQQKDHRPEQRRRLDRMDERQPSG